MQKVPPLRIKASTGFEEWYSDQIAKWSKSEFIKDQRAKGKNIDESTLYEGGRKKDKPSSS